ncbi:hypothetical protein [Blastococcus saxobsidens]|uniref:HipA-like C-terminal domain-containing protein n=1 Tax=Blastococcus saxobsidens (strain DD2) TaxID=1146883 RepID=H6RRY1_BLASD|nr:hypothetical protein [Blastococcus saxobsidens]CCG02975.1 conserved protein of unknown function [Blastococcus saxobsidens DD2]
MFALLDVQDWTREDFEPGGDEAKVWLTDPRSEHTRWLYKPPTVKTLKPPQDQPDLVRMYRRGEDWAEKLSAELAAFVGIPAAQVEFAVLDGQRGSMSRDLRPWEWAMHGGGVLIGGVDENYRPRDSADKRPNRIGHNLDNIQRVLADAHGPPHTEYTDWPAFDVFAGLLLFDAWIANTDRHEYNWAVLHGPAGELRLAPTFDHGSALGSGLMDQNRGQLVAHGQLRRWCERGFAHRFEDMGRTPLVAFAREALQRAGSPARAYWTSRIASVSADRCHALVDAVPNLSPATRTFVSNLLAINQERIRS